MTINIEGLGKITADKHVLNYLAILASEAKERFESISMNALAKEAKEVWIAIHEALEEKGYYND